MAKRDARKLSPEAQEDLRRRVVAAVDGGASKAEAARVFGVTRQSIHNWMNAVDEGGTAALKARKRGPKQGPRLLKPLQAASVVRTIVGSCPDQLRLPFALWTRGAVYDQCLSRYGLKVAALCDSACDMMNTRACIVRCCECCVVACLPHWK